MGPLLFLVFINDLPNSALCSFIHLFADDTKCSKQVICWNDVSNLQEDLDRLYSCSMKINGLSSSTIQSVLACLFPLLNHPSTLPTTSLVIVLNN